MTSNTARMPQTWDAGALSGSSCWRPYLPNAVIEEFGDHVSARPEIVRDIDGFELDHHALPRLSAFGQSIRQNILRGPGLCWVRGLGDAGMSEAERKLFFLAIGCAMGTPLTRYGRLYEVSDRGGDYTKTAIPVSQTKAGTGFHTDSSARDCVPDVVALLCEEPSIQGGESLVSNALHAHTVLEREAPELLRHLHRDLVRDVVTPGLPKTHEHLLQNRFPVFAQCNRSEGLLFRYMRFWIERGQEKAGRQLSEQELAALDALDEVLSDRQHAVQFQLAKGDMVWVNNRTLAHNRTEYHDDPGHRRRLQRLWLDVRAN